jgi:polyhydroxyalkanoate synthesis regulator phasin
MQDAWRAYLELAFGLTEASKKKAKKTAKELAGKGGATAAQLQSLAEDLLSASRANREALARLVRYEVDRAVGAVGLATAEEVAELNNRIRDLEQRAREPQSQPTATTSTAAPRTAAPRTTAPRTTVRKAVAKKTVAKKTVAKKTAATKTATRQTTVAPTTGTPAKASPAKASPAKKATG